MKKEAENEIFSQKIDHILYIAHYLLFYFSLMAKETGLLRVFDQCIDFRPCDFPLFFG
jgi:hypothetical protein